jgi:hypothetical protein
MFMMGILSNMANPIRISLSALIPGTKIHVAVIIKITVTSILVSGSRSACVMISSLRHPGRGFRRIQR